MNETNWTPDQQVSYSETGCQCEGQRAIRHFYCSLVLTCRSHLMGILLTVQTSLFANLLMQQLFSKLQHGYTTSLLIAAFCDSFCLGDTSFFLQLNLLKKHVLFSTLTSQVAAGLSSAITPARCSVYCENCKTPEQLFLHIWIINTWR